MIYNVRHETSLAYSASVAHAHFNLRLIPVNWPGQRASKTSLTLDPEPALRQEAHGPYMVNSTHVAFDEPLETLTIHAEFAVEVDALPLPDDGPSVDEIRASAIASRDLSNLSPVPFLFGSRIATIDPGIGDWAANYLDYGAPVIAVVKALTSAIYREFTYKPGTTTSDTLPADAFSAREGVCQDFAHVMIIALRAHGIPAGYASGYLRTIPPPGQERLVGADAMHAWAVVWCGEELGWVGFDPTNDCIAREDHILVAMGRDYADVAPIDGVFIGQAPQKMEVAVDVEPLTEKTE